MPDLNGPEHKSETDRNSLVLSERDFARFVAAINNPKPPSARLKAAAEEYKAVRREHPELNW